MGVTSGTASLKRMAGEEQTLTFMAPAPVMLSRCPRYIIHKLIIATASGIMCSPGRTHTLSRVTRKEQTLALIAPAPAHLIVSANFINGRKGGSGQGRRTMKLGKCGSCQTKGPKCGKELSTAHTKRKRRVDVAILLIHKRLLNMLLVQQPITNALDQRKS